MTIAAFVHDLESRDVVLWANGEKLGYRSPKGALSRDDLARLKAWKKEILEYLAQKHSVPHNEGARYEPFHMTDIQRAYATGQNSGFELGGTGCHSYVELRTAPLDPERLERAWHALIKRHDMLSAVVVAPDSLQVLESPVLPRLESVDLTGHDPDNPDADYLQHRLRMQNRSYPLGDWPLHEFRLLQFDHCSILQFSVDMIIADFVSVMVMTQELFDLYKGRKLPPLPETTFRDIIESRARKAETPEGSAARDSAKKYWAQAIQKLPGKPALPALSSSSQSSNTPVQFTRRTWACSAADWSRFKNTVSNYGVTASSALLTAYTDVLRRWSSASEFCVSVTSLNRDQSITDVNRIIGDFTEVTIHLCKAHQGSFVERVRATQEQLSTELSNAAYSGVEVLRDLGRASGATTMIPAVFTSALGSGAPSAPELDYEMVYGVSRTPQVWIDCQAVEHGDSLNINWDVRTGVFEPKLLDDMWCSFTAFLERLITHPENWQAEYTVPLPPSTEVVRSRVHDTTKAYSQRCLHNGFWENAQRAPEAPALVCGDTTYTYQQLAGFVESLQNELGSVSVGDRVAIVIGKDVWQIAAALAVVSTGAVYVPIDHEQPASRQNSMIKACRPTCIITDSHFGLQTGDVPIINVDTISPSGWSGAVPADVSPAAIAYIIFTSGSTGTPKGVVMTHGAAMNTIDDVNDSLGHAKPRTVIGVSKLSFDLSVYDIFGTLASGGTLVLPSDQEARDPSRWLTLMKDNRVDTWNTVPALFQMLLEEVAGADKTETPPLRLVLLSGDRIPSTLPSNARQHFSNCELISLGGATEGGIWSIYYPMTNHPDGFDVPYGTALSNQGMWVLDEFGNECPDGVQGHIHISGDSLAAGYFDDPATTLEKFFFCPKRNIRMYDTGDLGSYRDDGVIEFQGRSDHQVKINGHRVEMGEIESALESHELVDRSAVIGQTIDNRTKLHAFVTGTPSNLGNPHRKNNYQELRSLLEEHWEPAASGIDSETFAEWMRVGNEASLAALLKAFQSAGIFLHPTKRHSLTEITESVRPAAEYEDLISRWLQILVGEGLAAQDEQGWSISESTLEYYKFEELWANFERMEAQVRNSKELLDYQLGAAKTLLAQLRGEVNPVDVFFPRGQTDNARAIYGENRISNAINGAAAEAVINIAASYGDRPVRILEVGAGVGATTESIVDRLPSNVLEYRFTDISTFFLRKARESFKGYERMSYGLFDLNEECGPQEVDLGSYDIILCANVLHNAVNIYEAFDRLNQLRESGGFIVMVEPVTELYAALISVSIKMNLVNFTDHRKDSHRVFIQDDEWDQIYAATGLQRVAEYPQHGDPLRECGQRLIVVGALNAPLLREDELSSYLHTLLPNYMVPAAIHILPELPLTPNGKVDRAALAQFRSDSNNKRNVQSDPPLDDLERQIANVWSQILESSDLARDEDFYSLGGDSLLMAETVTRLRNEVTALNSLSWDALMREMLKAPTIAGIASFVRSRMDANGEAGSRVKGDALEPVSSEVAALSTISRSVSTSSNLHAYRIPEDATLCRAMFHAGTGRLKDYEYLMPELMQRQPEIAHVGFTAGDAEEFLECTTNMLIKERARTYAQQLDALDIESFELVGYCIGGMFALETAKVLTELGRNVRRVICISTHQCTHRISNELLCEVAYGCIFNADLRPMGANFELEDLSSALEHTLKGVNRDISDDELCNLNGTFAAVGKFFSEMAVMSPWARRKRIYRSIQDFDATSEETRKMLDILYDVFRHSLRGTIGYVPDPYFGDVLVLVPDQGVSGFYPSIGNDIDWSATVIGDLQVETVAGSHATCLLPDNVGSLLEFFKDSE